MLKEHKYKGYDDENGSAVARYSADTTSNSSDKVQVSLRKVCKAADDARDV